MSANAIKRQVIHLFAFLTFTRFHLNGLDSVGEVGKDPCFWCLEARSCSDDLGLISLTSSLRSDTTEPWLVHSGGFALKKLLPRKFSDELFFMLLIWGFVKCRKKYHWTRRVSQIYHRWMRRNLLIFWSVTTKVIKSQSPWTVNKHKDLLYLYPDVNSLVDPNNSLKRD